MVIILFLIWFLKLIGWVVNCLLFILLIGIVKVGIILWMWFVILLYFFCVDMIKLVIWLVWFNLIWVYGIIGEFIMLSGFSVKLLCKNLYLCVVVDILIIGFILVLLWFMIMVLWLLYLVFNVFKKKVVSWF